MNKILYLLLTILLGAGYTRGENIRGEFGKPVSPKEYQQLLGKGLDVDWWNRNSEKKNGDYSDSAVEAFAKQGIGHVRIRIHHYQFTDDDFARLDHQIAICLKNRIIPVVAFSAKPYKTNPSNDARRKVLDWWRKMAEHNRFQSYLVSFDLIIEPSEALKKNVDELNFLYEACVSAIRETNPHRILFIAPNKLSNPEGLKDLKIPSQSNGYVMAEWHFYASGPDKRNPKKLWTTGTEDEKNLIRRKIETALSWQSQTGLYTWVGAWMPGNYNKGNDYTIEEQIAFSTFMRTELEKHGIPFAVNSDKVFYDYSQDKWNGEKWKLFEAIFH